MIFKILISAIKALHLWWVSFINIILFTLIDYSNGVRFTRWNFSLELKLIEDENRTTDNLKGSMEMFVTKVFGDHKSRLN